MRVVAVLVLLVGLPLCRAAAQERDISGRTAAPAPRLITLQPAKLQVTARNAVVLLDFSGLNFRLGGDDRRRKLLVREPRGRWLQVAGLPSSDSRWTAELTTVPWLQQPGTIEFKAIVDGIESNVFRVEVRP